MVWAASAYHQLLTLFFPSHFQIKRSHHLEYCLRSPSITSIRLSWSGRKKIANGGGLFFRVKMQVACAQGTSTVKVSFAQLAGLKDPNSKTNDLVGYTLDDKTLSTTSATLTVNSHGVAATAIPMDQASQQYREAAPGQLPSLTVLVGAAAAVVVLSGAAATLFLRMRSVSSSRTK
jgi:hypothetical protein